MSRPSVNTTRFNVTLSEVQVKKVEQVAANLGYSSTGETLRFLISQGLQTQAANLGANANQDMANAFKELVSIMAQGAEMEKAGKGSASL